MDGAGWDRVDRYLESELGEDDPVLSGALSAAKAAGLPEIQVAPNQGRLLGLLARAIGARRILEVGTLGGYSGLCLARALPADGRLITLELEPRHAEVARANFERAGLAGRIEIRLGAASESLAALERERAPPFDMSFIDADKPSTPAYLDAAIRLSRPGALIAVDNVIREGAVADATSADPNVRGIRSMFRRLASDRRVAVATAIQTVGQKGHDGWAFILVR
jgi:predicted O-methyltransferase YrrM